MRIADKIPNLRARSCRGNLEQHLYTEVLQVLAKKSGGWQSHERRKKKTKRKRNYKAKEKYRTSEFSRNLMASDIADKTLRPESPKRRNTKINQNERRGNSRLQVRQPPTLAAHSTRMKRNRTAEVAVGVPALGALLAALLVLFPSLIYSLCMHEEALLV